jgi:hypothetical protein
MKLISIISFQALGVDCTNYPKLNDWYMRCQSLPGFDENLKGGTFLAEMILDGIGGTF